MTAKILYQARKQQSELQDEYGIGGDDQDQDANNNVNRAMTRVAFKTGGGPRGDGKQTMMSLDLANEIDDDSGSNGNILSRPFKKFQTNFKQQQKIRKSDHDDSDSDSDTDEQLDSGENKHELFNDEEIVNFVIFCFCFKAFKKRSKVSAWFTSYLTKYNFVLLFYQYKPSFSYF